MCKLIDTKPGSIGGGSAICIAALLALTSCAGFEKSQNAVGSFLDAVTAACQVYAPVAAPLMTLPDAKVQSLATYGNAVCGPTGSVVAGFAPDAGTAAWVGALTGSLRALAEVRAVKPPVNG